MESRKEYRGLVCLPILPSKSRQAEQRAPVLEKSPEVYDNDRLLEHPAIPGLMLALDQRLSLDHLKIVDCDNDCLLHTETLTQRSCRLKWEKPVPPTRSSTDGDFVNMNFGLFPTSELDVPTHFYLRDIHALEKRVADEKEFLRRQEAEAAAAKAAEVQREAADALARAEEEATSIAALRAKESEIVAAAVISVLNKLHGLLKPAREAAEKLKLEGANRTQKSQRQNLEWRLASVQSRLQMLIAEIEEGKLLRELQFLAGEDLEEEIEIMADEIALLIRSIQVLKSNERGL